MNLSARTRVLRQSVTAIPGARAHVDQKSEKISGEESVRLWGMISRALVSIPDSLRRVEFATWDAHSKVAATYTRWLGVCTRRCQKGHRRQLGPAGSGVQETTHRRRSNVVSLSHLLAVWFPVRYLASISVFHNRLGHPNSNSHLSRCAHHDRDIYGRVPQLFLVRALVISSRPSGFKISGYRAIIPRLICPHVRDVARAGGLQDDISKGNSNFFFFHLYHYSSQVVRFVTF